MTGLTNFQRHLMISKNRKWSLFHKEVIVDEEDNEYLVRYRIFDTPWLRLYLHIIKRSDGDRDMHDHPWNFLSFILRGGYFEYTPWTRKTPYHNEWKGVGSIIRHSASDLHRIELLENKHCWSLVLAGTKSRKWGFQTNKGWVHNGAYNDTKRIR